MRPTAWKRHWRVRVEVNSGESRRFMSLASRHWHTVLNLTCVVTDPGRNRWRATWAPAVGGAQQLLKPGATGGPLIYPGDFAAPPVAPGRYKVTWLTDVEHGDRPIVLARKRWRAPPPEPVTAPTFNPAEWAATLDGGLIPREEAERREAAKHQEILDAVATIHRRGEEIRNEAPQSSEEYADQWTRGDNWIAFAAGFMEGPVPQRPSQQEEPDVFLRRMDTVLAGLQRILDRETSAVEPSVDSLKRDLAAETVRRLDAVIDEAQRVSALCPTNRDEWLEPSPDVLIRVDAWRARGDDAIALWHEFQDDLAVADEPGLPRYHAVNIGHRNDMLIAIRGTLRQR